MRPTKGIRRGVILSLGALMLAGCGKSADELMERAEEMRDKGRYQSAIADYREVLERTDENAEARFGIGVAELRLGDYEAAVSALERARDGGVSPARVEPLMARALVWDGQLDRVHEVTEPSSLSDESARAEVWALRGGAHRRAGNTEAARQAFEKALDIRDDNVTALVGKARLATQAQAYERAESLAQRALDANDDSPAAWLARADNARAAGQRDKALAAYKSLLDKPVTDIAGHEQFRARARYAQLLLGDGKREAAREQSEILLKQASEHPYANYIAALIAYTGDELDTAKEHLQVVLSKAPDNLQANYLMGAVRVQKEEYVQAVDNLRGVVSENPRDVRARALLATAYRGAGNDPEASRVLAEGIGYAADNPRALAYLRNAAGDNVDSVVAAFREKAQSNPDLRDAGMRFAQTLVGLGDSEPAMSLLEQGDIAEGDSEVMRRQFVALAALQSGDGDKAAGEAKALREQHPDNVAAHNVAGGIYMALERFDKARKAFERSRELAPEAAQSSFNLGLLAMAQGNLDEATSHLQQSIEQDSEMLEPRMALAQVAYRRGNPQRAEAVLEEAGEAFADSVQPHYALARLHRETGNSVAARRAADTALERAPENPDLLKFAGRLDLDAGNHDAAVAHYRAAIEGGADNRETRLRLAQALDAAGKKDASIKALEELVAENPDDKRARLTLGLAYVRQDKIDEALAQADALRSAEGGEGAAALLEGRARAAEGEHAKAVDAFEDAVASGRRDALAPLVTSRRQAGMEEPAAPVEAWLEDNADDDRVRLSLAQWYTQQRRYAKAVPHYEKLVEATDQPSAGILNNLAYAYIQTGDSQALETARQALELAPDNAAITDTAGWAELKAGNARRAVELLEKAVSKAGDAPDIRYHYGVALAEVGRSSTARQQLERALSADGDFPWRQAAEKRLRELD